MQLHVPVDFRGKALIAFFQKDGPLTGVVGGSLYEWSAASHALPALDPCRSDTSGHHLKEDKMLLEIGVKEGETLTLWTASMLCD